MRDNQGLVGHKSIFLAETPIRSLGCFDDAVTTMATGCCVFVLGSECVQGIYGQPQNLYQVFNRNLATLEEDLRLHIEFSIVWSCL
jgi:hypothetical protein